MLMGFMDHGFFVGESSNSSEMITQEKWPGKSMEVKHTYHLVMTLPVRHGKIHHAIKNGKPSISMGHLYHGELLNNQSVNDLMIFDQILISVKYLDMIAQIGDQI